MSRKEPRGRLFQDAEFVFDEFNGLKIERLIICQNTKTEEPILIYLKVENRNWHQYFLDAGIGCWGNWDELDAMEDDEHYTYIDATEKLNLKGKQILKIECSKDFANAKISIELENGEQLILKCVHPKVFDADCEFIKIPKTA